MDIGLSHPYEISVAGVPLLPNVDYDVVEVVVDLRNDMPGMCTIRIQDRRIGVSELQSYTYTDLPLPFIVGAPLTVSFINAQPSLMPPIPTPVFIGEITGLETEFGENFEAFLTVRAHHRTHRLQRGVKSQAFMFQPDNLIVTTVCAEAGVIVTATPTGGPNEYVLQNNQSAWDFIQERSRLIGYELRATQLGTFEYVPKGVPSPGAPVILTYHNNLLQFTGRVSTHGQVSMVEIDVKDPKLPSPLAVPALVPVPPTPLGGNTLRILADYGAGMATAATAKRMVSDQPQADIASAGAQVAALVKDQLSSFVTAEGDAMGNPNLLPGTAVMVMNTGVKFTGPYILSSATHTFVPGVGYRTHFTVSGSKPDTMLGILADSSSKPKRVQGVMVGTVTNNMDPLGQGRVKVMFPNLGSTPPILSNWCRIAAGSGGLMSGSYFIPDVNTDVLVAFEHGDVNFPYVVGTLWNSLNLPPKPSTTVVVGGKVMERIIQTPFGLNITMSDLPGKQGITLSDKLGLNSIVLDATKGAINLKALTEVAVDTVSFKVAAKAKVYIEGLGDVGLVSKGAMKIESNILSVKGAVNVNLKGGMVSIAGDGGLNLKGGAASIAMVGPSVSINNGALEVM